MRLKQLYIATSLTFFILIFAQDLSFSQERFKSVRLFGLKIVQEETLLRELHLYNIPAGPSQFENVSSRIHEYLHARGYDIAHSYLVRETPDELLIYIDEGVIERLIFKNISSINTLRLRYELKFEKDIYNSVSINKSLHEIKTRFNFKDARAILVKVRNYDKSFFQIDREFEVPVLKNIKIPIIKEYKPRYNLEIHLESFDSDEKGGMSYGLKTNYSKGLRPYVRYTLPSIAGKGDRLNLGTSVGIFYGLDLEPKTPPRWTYMEFRAEYELPPAFEQFFTPSTKGYVYRSWSSRNDIGLERYEYLILRGTLSPGITLLKKLKIYAGYGAERVFVYKGETAADAKFTAEIIERTENWSFFEIGVNLNLFPRLFHDFTKRRFQFTYNSYMNSTEFYRLLFEGSIGFEFDNYDFLSLEMDSVWFNNSPPFYHEESVDSDNFRGFMGKSYHSKRLLRLSGEYRVSIYRSYVFAGIFTDGVVFIGSGYDLEGKQAGAVGGISGHFLFLDQFEANIYFGKDRLISSGESQYNIYANFKKKW